MYEAEYRFALQNAGFDVISYDNGLSAYQRLREEPFEMLLTDIVMPEMDGISLLTITVLAVFVGFEVVSKVSSTLHTPLMSGANAIHGIILVGARPDGAGGKCENKGHASGSHGPEYYISGRSRLACCRCARMPGRSRRWSRRSAWLAWRFRYRAAARVRCR